MARGENKNSIFELIYQLENIHSDLYRNYNKEQFYKEAKKIKNLDRLDAKVKKKKKKKYSTEMERFELLDDRIIIHSEHGTRTKKVDDKYICDCEFYQKNHTCSHIISIINLNLSFDNENVKKIN